MILDVWGLETANDLYPILFSNAKKVDKGYHVLFNTSVPIVGPTQLYFVVPW